MAMKLAGFADRVDTPFLTSHHSSVRHAEAEPSTSRHAEAEPSTPPRPAAARRLSADEKTCFSSLPDELLVVIPTRLETPDLVAFASVSTAVRALFTDALGAARRAWENRTERVRWADCEMAGVAFSNGLCTATRAGENEEKALAGLPLMPTRTARSHAWELRIDQSFCDSAKGLCVGVADETGERAWALSAFCGSAVRWDRARGLLPTAPQKLMKGNLQDHADGSVVRVAVERGRLRVQVNGGATKEAPFDLPDVVRPWARLCFRRDRVTLNGQITGAAAVQCRALAHRAVRGMES